MIPLSYTFAKPVIESNLLSVTECVEHGKTSLNFDVNDSKQLANYIIDLFENNSKFTKMGTPAYQKMLKEIIFVSNVLCTILYQM